MVVQKITITLVLILALLVAACGGEQRSPTPTQSVISPSPSVAPTSPSTSNPVPSPTQIAASQSTPTQVATEETNKPSQEPTKEPTPNPTPSATQERKVNRNVRVGIRQVASGFDQPLFITYANDNSNRLFVVEKGGKIKFLDGQIFLDITNRVGSSGSEQGLLGLAFHPNYRVNRRFFVDYTDLNGNTVVAEFRALDNGRRADPNSEKVILRQEQPAANHNGGMLAFGPDGYLYIALGDGGGANDTYGNGQNLNTLLAKILRIDVDRGDPYSIPKDNPFVGRDNARPETWAWGLRNPWRFSFDRQTGDLYIADVGQNHWEEINYQRAGSKGGQNYGWPIMEGNHCLSSDQCNQEGLTLPVAEYSHELGCSVTGGYVYRGKRFPALRGKYFFGDYCTGRIWSLQRAENANWVMKEETDTDLSISSFGEDQNGEIYVTDLAGGGIYMLTASS